MKIFSQRNYINTLLAVALIILTASNIMSYRQMQGLLKTNEWVIHTHNVIEAAADLHLAIIDIESKTLQSKLENTPLSPQDFKTGLNKVDQYIGILRQLTIDNPSQQKNLDIISSIENERAAYLQKIYNTNTIDHSTYDNRQARKQVLFEAIHSMIQREQYLLQARTAMFANNTRSNKLTSIIIDVVSEGLLLLSLILLNNYLAQRDLAENKKAESEVQLRLIIDGTRDYAIIMLNPEGNITTWSAGAEKIMGYKESEILGSNFSSFYTKESIAHHCPEIELEIAKAEGRYEDEGLRLRKDGSKYLANVVITALHDKQGTLLGFGQITRDMSERKRIEQMKNEFISVVSHELRTPITSIRGALGLVIGGAVGSFTDKARKLLEIANHNCERLLLLINDILDIEKIEAGKMTFQLKIVELHQLIEEAVTANTIYGKKYGINLDITHIIENIKVNVDTDRLIQVLTNLISNAVKFSSKASPVSISMSEKKDFIRVSITNRGRGISKEFQPRIFQKFSQADSSDRRSKDGSGLGLNISKAIIEKMGGTLNFKSIPNEETSFYFDLPVCPHFPADVSDNTSRNLLLLRNKKILICEDDEDQANYLKVLLESAGYQSDIAYTVAEAKALLEKSTYQALLLDLILPDEDGISFIRELRSKEITERLPIIVQSIIAQTGRTLINGEAFAVVDWLDKPVDFSKLLHSITLVKIKANQYKPHILHVEDDIDAHKMIKTMLEENVDITVVTSIDEARKKLLQEKFDLVILDLLLQDGNGAELLPLMSKYKLPIIVYSSIQLDHQYSKYVTQTLIKSKTSSEELINLIKTIIEDSF
jgi:PAS domain S-box-containing protein